MSCVFSAMPVVSGRLGKNFTRASDKGVMRTSKAALFVCASSRSRPGGSGFPCLRHRRGTRSGSRSISGRAPIGGISRCPGEKARRPTTRGDAQVSPGEKKATSGERERQEARRNCDAPALAGSMLSEQRRRPAFANQARIERAIMR